MCTQPLIIPIEVEDDNDEEIETASMTAGIVDDVELLCGHHYHWSCFSDSYHSAENKTQCPTCNVVVVDPATSKLLVTLHNEGGVQGSYDIGAMLEEEAFYDNNPEFKKIRAFLEFCAEGDVTTVTEMIDEDAGVVNSQDFETGQTGLHVAVQNRREDVLGLLLGKGADKEVRDAAGRTFYEFAVELGATDAELRALGAL